MHRLITRAAVALGACATVAAGGLGLTAAHAADDPNAFVVQYDVTGSTTLTKTKLTVPLGPTKISVTLGATNDFTANLPLPPQKVYFKAFGYLPVRATVLFTQVGPVNGSLSFAEDGSGRTSVFSAARYTVTLRDVIVGYTKANVGNNCQTVAPIDVYASSTDGTFDLGLGGKLTATYDLGKFKNCGTSTDLTNLIVPSQSNPLTLDLSNFQIPDTGAAKTKVQQKFARAAR